MDDTTQIMGNKHETLSIFNVYAPSTHGNLPEVVANFWMHLEQHLTKVPKRQVSIVGGDINARIGC
jgi:hypothetical protein